MPSSYPASIRAWVLVGLVSMMKAAMAYPIVLAGLSVCTVLVLLFFVLPQFGFQAFVFLNGFCTYAQQV